MNKTCSPCQDCPIPNQCLAIAMPVKFGHWCEWAKSGNELKRRAIVGRSKIGITEADKVEPPRIPVAVTLDLIARMKECPSWEASSSCGCGNNKCRLGKGRGGIVSHADCFACLRAQRV